MTPTGVRIMQHWIRLLVALLALGIHASSTQGDDCPPCHIPNPNFDLTHPYPNEQSEPKCILKPSDFGPISSMPASCQGPQYVSSVISAGDDVFGKTTPCPFTCDTFICKEGCDGQGNKKWRIEGQVECNMTMFVSTELTIPPNCPNAGQTRSRSTDALARTAAHELVHCNAVKSFIEALNRQVANGPLYNSAQECDRARSALCLAASTAYALLILAQRQHCPDFANQPICRVTCDGTEVSSGNCYCPELSNAPCN